jgi:hypothetical protein
MEPGCEWVTGFVKRPADQPRQRRLLIVREVKLGHHRGFAKPRQP